MGLLCGHSSAITLRAAHRAPMRIVACTPYAIEPSRKRIAFVMLSLPMTKAHTAQLLYTWLHRCARWDGNKYASFHVTHVGGHHELCADWNTDWFVLQSIATQSPIQWEVRGGVACLFYLIPYVRAAFDFDVALCPPQKWSSALSSHRPFAKGASGRFRLLPSLFSPSCELHVLHVVLILLQPTNT